MKKVITLVLALILTVSAAVGGTVAYLTAEDSDVNVMTVGNVKIEQLEYERVVENGAWVSINETDKYGYTPDKLQEFTQNKPLYPAYFADGVIKWDDRNGNQDASGTGSHQQSWAQIGASGSNQLFDDSVHGAIDKFVFVKNTGRSDAFVRTFFAFELGTLPAEDFNDVIMTNANKNHWSWESIGVVDIDGCNYYVMSATYLGPKSNPTGILAKDTVSYPSLLQVYMKPGATNEQVAAVDGNGNELYDIMVFSQAVQTENLTKFSDAPATIDTDETTKTYTIAERALNVAFYGSEIPDETTVAEKVAEWCGGVWEEYITPAVDVWDGSIDTTWYNDTDTEFTLTTAEQFAGFGNLVDEGNTFAGKTINLGIDLDLYLKGEDGDPISFNPIGYGYNVVFKGTFDGQGHTISNLYQNGWALGYDYSTEAGGLFASVVDATIKNLNIDKSEIIMECIDMGTLVGYSYGTCTYENISITNSSISNYNRYTGGVVGEVNGTQVFKNVDIDSNSTVSTLWGSFDTSVGGIIGGKYGEADITFEDCDVACQIDSYNDITATPSRQWYAYRRAGMLIGNSEEYVDDNGRAVASASYLTAINCTVTYGDWANYTYCEFNNMSTSWPHCRVQGCSSPAYTNGRYGTAKDADGNAIVDINHVHAEGEDHNILIEFDQLFGGEVGVYGGTTHEGVNVIYNNR